jgi:hypothetical protein
LKSLKLSMGLFGHHLLASSGFCWLSCYLSPKPASAPVADISQGAEESAANGGFRDLAAGLHLPISLFCAAKFPKVSGPIREYTRFAETAAC